ncbi:hypothetical protein [Chroococcidiopsis cubana]|nr:hypothetical protein [Chroococcidiopsis cubana]
MSIVSLEDRQVLRDEAVYWHIEENFGHAACRSLGYGASAHATTSQRGGG